MTAPHPPARSTLPPRAAGRRAALRGLAAVGLVGTGLAGLSWPRAARAEGLELLSLSASRQDQGLVLDFDTRFELPQGVEGALQKGVALHFVAEASLLRSRWYWRDKRVAQATRTWRLTYQPLTFSYRVNFGGLGQTYRTLGEALRAVQKSVAWRIADLPAGEDGTHYVEFSYRLDRDRLPRPLEIGLGAQREWHLEVDRTLPVDLR